MSLHIFTVPVLDADRKIEVVNQFIEQHTVTGVDKQFVSNGENSFWSFCVTKTDSTFDKSIRTQKNQKHKGIDYKEVLSPEDFARYVKLRNLRKEIGLAEGLPVYSIFSNAQLAEMVTKKVATKAEMAKIAGIGEKRLDQYATAFLDAIKEDSLPEKSDKT